MSAFDDWYDPNDYRLSLMDPEYIAKEAFNAGMERAAKIVKSSCIDCGGAGFTVRMVPVMVGIESDGEPIEGAEPEQEQCQYCYQVTFPLEEAIRKEIEK